MLIENSVDEVKKRETSLKIIKSIINNYGRDDLYDFTGLSGGFLATVNDLSLLETYVGPAIFEEQLQILGKIHLGGEKIFPVNRTSSGILATILALVPKNSYVVHFLPEFPSHPSIPRSCKLKDVNYIEFDDISKFHTPENTSLIIITGATMDHKIIDEEVFEKIIAIAKEKHIHVLVDDASGARLRTSIYKQKKAIELGADLVVTSTDKLMMGPRGGLMAGKTDLINEIKSYDTKFGLEAYNENNLLDSIEKRKELIKLLKNDFKMFKETPTGVMVSENSLKEEITNHNVDIIFSPKDLCFLWAMILLKDEHIITIPAVSMPGASATVRFDLASNDAIKIDIATLQVKIKNSFENLLKVATDEVIAKDILFDYK
jgi:L-seryl-tRNA(Ser) seleniumtransferase